MVPTVRSRPSRCRPRSRSRRLSVPAALLRAALLLLALAGVAAAPEAGGDGAADAPEGAAASAEAVADIRGDDPAEVADRAVTAWLESGRDPPSLVSLADDPEALCRELPALLAAPPAGPDTRVNLDDRQERELDPAQVPEGAERRRYTYSAVAAETLQVVEVVVERPAGEASWRPLRVGFFQADAGDGRAWLRSPWAAGLFALFSALVLVDLLRGGRIGGWLREGLRTVREHRRLVILTQLALWGLFGAGALVGASAPDVCADAALALLDTALSNVGATQAIASGNALIAATVIFFQNFVVVTVTLLFGSALLLGVPAYLIAGLSFFFQGIPFGLLGGGGPLELLFVAVLLLLELCAYFLVVAGGGMLLSGVIRGGFGAIGPSVRKLLLMLPIAGLLLLVGAWYEAAVILLAR